MLGTWVVSVADRLTARVCLRREPALREARQWFLVEFNPESFAELAAMAGGPPQAA